MVKTDIGGFLAALRKSKGYTQQEAADLLGVSNKTVSNWETGASSPDISMLPALAELYGVTCDEIARGRRIPPAEDGKGAQQKREKAMARLLEKHRADLTTLCWVCGGLCALGVILTLVIGCAALESLLGFFIGLIFLLASAAVAAAWAKRIRFAVGGEAESAGAEALKRSLSSAVFSILCADVAALGFIFPHLFCPVHTGLQLIAALGFGAMGAAAGLVLDALLLFPVRLHVRSRALRGEEESAEEAGPRAEAVRAEGRSLALTRRRYRNALLLFGIPLLALAIAVFALSVALAGAPQPVFSTTEYSFGTREELVAFAEESRLFSQYGHTLVREEEPEAGSDQPWDEAEAVFLFADFPEEYSAGYCTEAGEGATLVTVFRYTVREANGGESFSFYAFNPALQGGVVDIETYSHSYTDEDGQSVTIGSYRISALPTLWETAELEEMQGVHDAIAWGLLAAFLLYDISLAVCIPLYIRADRRYKRQLRENGVNACGKTGTGA